MTTLLSLLVKIGIKDEASSQIAKTSSGIKSNLSNAAQMGKAALMGLGAAAGAVATGVGAIGKAAFDGYKDYQQLWGGVQKLYGTAGQSLEEYAASVGQTVDEASGKFEQLTQAQNMMLDQASNAWKTAGMDANSYMENATSFSAALINSLGGDTVAAADMTDRAMTAIADNYNTFGGDMQSVTNAFQGFAKQNYTMLDNLKLGYAGTKEGMEQLIADANEWGAANGAASDLSIDSFADVVVAIEQVQKKQGIYGTTQREAMTTIEGSINATKAAWENFLTALGGGLEVSSTIDALVEAATAASENIVEEFNQIAEKMAEALPLLVPKALELGMQIMGAVINGISSALPGIVTAVAGVAPMLLAGVQSLITQAATFIMENKAEIANGAVEAFMGLLEGLVQVAPTVIAAILSLLSELVLSVISHAPQMLAAAGELIAGIIEGINEGTSSVQTAIGDVVQGAVNAVGEFVGEFFSAGANLIGGLIDGVASKAGELVSAAKGAVDGAIQGAKNLLGIASPSKVFMGIGNYTMEGFAIGIEDAAKSAQNAMKHAMESVEPDMSGSYEASGRINYSASDAFGQSSIIAELQSLRADLSNVKLWMDGKAVVGYLTPSINESLRMMEVANAR